MFSVFEVTTIFTTIMQFINALLDNCLEKDRWINVRLLNFFCDFFGRVIKCARAFLTNKIIADQRGVVDGTTSSHTKDPGSNPDLGMVVLSLFFYGKYCPRISFTTFAGVYLLWNHFIFVN